MEKPSILIVDDEESILISLASILKKESYRTKTASNGLIALNMLQKAHYDLILTDIMMDDMTGIELLKKTKESFPEIAVLLMTGYANLDTAIEAVRLGASDYLIKPCSKKTIFLSIARCLEKNIITKRKSTLPQYPRRNRNVLPINVQLSKRELEVYNHLISGMSDKSIAKALAVTVPTIKFHTKNIYRKLGVSGRNGILKILSSK